MSISTDHTNLEVPRERNQCPVKADGAIDYHTYYGFPEAAEYDVVEVRKSNLLTIEDLEARKREEQEGEECEYR
jgi:hypothetical protein